VAGATGVKGVGGRVHIICVVAKGSDTFAQSRTFLIKR
jgi:hypothetical protein